MAILLSARGTAGSDIWFTCLTDKPCNGVKLPSEEQWCLLKSYVQLKQHHRIIIQNIFPVLTSNIVNVSTGKHLLRDGQTSRGAIISLPVCRIHTSQRDVPNAKVMTPDYGAERTCVTKKLSIGGHTPTHCGWR